MFTGLCDLRDNLTTDTNGLPHSVGKLVHSCIDDLAKHLIGISAVVTDCLGGLGEVVIEGNGIRLSIIDCFDSGERGTVVLDELGQAVHQLAAVNAGQVAPTWVIQSSASCLDGFVDILGGSCVD